MNETQWHILTTNTMNSAEILRLLKNLTVDSEQMKVNRKMTRKTSTKGKKVS